MNDYFVVMNYITKDNTIKGCKWDVVSSESKMTKEFVQHVQNFLEEKYPDWQICIISIQRLDPS